MVVVISRAFDMMEMFMMATLSMTLFRQFENFVVPMDYLNARLNAVPDEIRQLRC